MSISVVIPCLNEEDCIVSCIRRAKEAFAAEELEILVADNGSTDRSVELAEAEGARVVHERRQGYGAAIMRGLQEAKGEYLVFGDADDTYDFMDGLVLVEELKKGAEFAVGNRLSDRLEPGAMPWIHQHIGTPILTGLLNWFYGSKVKDINCGLRAMRREVLHRLKLRSPGMEFASEMVIHAHKAGLKIAERPIAYRKRGGGEAKLRTIRDGWRHLRFILLCAPFHLFVIPGVLGLGVSMVLLFWDRFGFQVLGSLVSMLSTQVIIFGLLAKSILWVADSFLVDRRMGRLFDSFRLEQGILAAVFVVIIGAVFFLQVDLANLVRGATFMAIGFQLFFASFLLSIVLFKRPLADGFLGTSSRRESSSVLEAGYDKYPSSASQR